MKNQRHISMKMSVLLACLLFGFLTSGFAQTSCSKFFWTNPPTISGATATGTINGNNYVYTTTAPATPTTSLFNHAIFPASFGVPNYNPTIRNIFVSTNTLTFTNPVVNPILVFASIGQSGIAVPIVFSSPVTILFSTAVTVNSPTKITGNEGFAIVQMQGVFTTFSFDYLAQENYVNFVFGASTQCEIEVTDACNCTAGVDLNNNGVKDLVQETITISAQSGQTIMLTTAGGLVQADGVTPASGTATDNANGTYTYSAYLPANGFATYSAEFAISGGGVDNGTKPMIGGGPCIPCPDPCANSTLAVSSSPKCQSILTGFGITQDATLKATASGGIGAYNFLWTPGGATTDSITVSPGTTTFYVVTATDSIGCQAADTSAVVVTDVNSCEPNNPKKVMVCHVPPGNPANMHTICISENAVPAHFGGAIGHGTCFVGPCDDPCDTLNWPSPPPTGPAFAPEELDVDLGPNPSSGIVQILVYSNKAGKMKAGVFGSDGETAADLFDGDVEGGSYHMMKFEGGSFPPGIYYLNVSMENAFVTRKILIIGD